MPVYTLFTAIVLVMGVGSQALVGIFLGCGNISKANNSFKSAFLFVMAISIVLVLVVLAFSDELMGLLGANDRLLPHATDYINTICVFFPLFTVVMLADYLLKSIGKPSQGLILYSMAVGLFTFRRI